MIDPNALKKAAMIGTLHYTFSTYWLTALSVAWQTWGSLFLSPALMDKLNIPETGLWQMPRSNQPLQIFWFPFWTQTKLRTFVLVTGVSYALIAKFGTETWMPLHGLVIGALLITMVIWAAKFALSDKGHLSEGFYLAFNFAALDWIIQQVLTH
ncbi:hypothetical protein [Vibrio parahaemolyticus]|uniref:hypothetical protein n=1 Tax=Vibrio parahaemolyticus TaxID=670 RepID=UPI001121B677|nr:hypothetical protein [Vibrio parahaemolyticus]TOG90267.1 hypothetical protein CGI92_21930 [Vibrio parahaemolyticus]